jgi:hypothetical protein
MKTKNIICSVFCFILLAIFTSCEDYLNKKEDEPMTFNKIWTKREYIEKYYGTVWSFMPNEINFANSPFMGTADDASLAFRNAHKNMNNGTWSPNNVPFGADLWTRFYKGIREANIFLQNIDKCSDQTITQIEIDRWKADIRFVRAYYYFLLYRTYGPVILIGDEIVDFQQETFTNPRNTLGECEIYIQQELLSAAEVLPVSIDKVSDNTNMGRPTKGTCLALISRLKLYAARPLYNGYSLYTNVKNHDGTPLFPSSPNPGKWTDAAAAAKALISLSENNGNIYKLHIEGDPATNFADACKSYQNLFLTDWDDEIIFGRYGNRYYWQVLETPAVVGGTCYGASGPTQSMVDTYAMKTGRYPITGYNSNGSPIIDQESGYVETGFTNFTHPIDKTNGKGALSTLNMFINREPRFYVSVLWSSAWWPYTGANKQPVFAYNGNSGPGPRHDYPPSGYMTRKFVNPSANTAGGTWSNMTFPIIRLAEIYLNYAEALNESNPSNPDLYIYLNKVRNRAGLKNIEVVYPEVAGGANPLKMRELILKERQIELFFEVHRYFDSRQWLLEERLSNGPIYGMNTMLETKNPNITPIGFWQRTPIENRVFKPKHYLFPMHQSDLDRNSEMVQNYGW